MAKLTDGKAGSIAKADLPEKGQRFIFDDHRDAPRGFGLRITKAGGKAFILKYTFDGRERRKTIGDWPTWSLEAARAEAQELVRAINIGNDPLEAKRRRRGEPTVSELATEWLDLHAAGLKSEQAIRTLIGGDLVKAIGNMKVTDVRRRDVIDAIEAKAIKTPRQAAILLAYSRKLMDFATDRDIIPANPLAGLKPSAIRVKGKRDPLKAVARGRVLDSDEIKSFWENSEKSGLHKITALALKLVLVTGQRPGEVAGMHQEEINGRLWNIPASRRGKTDTPHTVYLTDTALQIIADAKVEIERLQDRRKVLASGYVFEASPGKSIGNAALSRAVERAHEALGAKLTEPWGRWTPHDLRRTMRTGLSACKVRPDIAELTIGHTKRGIVAVYDQHAFDDERRIALEAWEVRLKAILAGRDPDAKDSADIIQLKGARA
ncbi:tyrosine-type recombinase/integrase [Roseobacter litoralis]|uniref:tyrosine-type recombinase/integrase n=1 Tax=Roseobacter litoralis TaxID=42443 RepID=UPI0024934D93|nr:site-specific integrase [Roseobacter litoralis]